MALKTSLMCALLLLAVGCGAPADDAPTAAAPAEELSDGQGQPADAPSADEIAAAEAEWRARQDEINGVLSSMDRASFIGDSPTKGNPNAEVVVVKFSDFECPFCAVAAGHMKDFVAEREEEVLYVYKHLPLESIHPEAEPASKASWAAAQQGQFWLYHNGLFANQNRLGDDFYDELAGQIGLDVEQFNRDRNSKAAQAAVDADLALAQQLKLRGTPSFLMGGLLIPPGVPPDSFGQLLDNLKSAPPASQTP